jgi:hypothetical protein
VIGRATRPKPTFTSYPTLFHPRIRHQNCLSPKSFWNDFLPLCFPVFLIFCYCRFLNLLSRRVQIIIPHILMNSSNNLVEFGEHNNDWNLADDSPEVSKELPIASVNRTGFVFTGDTIPRERLVFGIKDSRRTYQIQWRFSANFPLLLLSFMKLTIFSKFSVSEASKPPES